MEQKPPSPIRIAQLGLSGVVLTSATLVFTGLPELLASEGPYLLLTLIAPGLLGGAILAELAYGVSVDRILLGIPAGGILLLSTVALLTLFMTSSGGVFFGGFFTLIAGSLIGVAVIARQCIGTFRRYRSNGVESTT